MTTLTIILISYIAISQMWFIIFVNASRKTTHKIWFIIITLLLQPISISALCVQYFVADRKNKLKGEVK